jgi:cytochrome c oxidase accessory protein FixG
MAGYAREQVCTYMCPYARFQSAMFDKDTLIIAYDEARGEPRGKHKAGDSWEGKGHCIDCDSCVVVCPVGIDIRHGLQMECIACGLCIDACDNVMEKIGLPKGLIRYDTESKKKFNPFRPRTFWYGGIIALVAAVMLYTLLTRSPLEMSVIHDRNPLLVTLSDGAVRNGYNITIMNKHHEDMHYALSVEGMDDANIRVQASSDIPADNLPVFADSVGHFRVFLTASKQSDHRRKITFRLVETDSIVAVEKDTIFVSEAR